jgi:predicted CXXCH cytochrome family protein
MNTMAQYSGSPSRSARLGAATAIAAGTALFLAAIPALADGGPHVKTVNNGSSTLTADSCAGCHRAHTAQGALLLTTDEEALCLTCHGTLGTGATTNVEDGVQYTAVNNGTYGGDTGPVLGALRGGGFVHARIDSSNAARVLTCVDKSTSCRLGELAKVRALAAGAPVTSAHLNLPENGLSLPQVAWGNGAVSLTENVGPTVILGCASCHNPHGNGNYRILNPIPAPEVSSGTFTPVASPGVSVTDGTLPGATDGARNYTIIQTQGGTGTLLASQAATAAGTAGATSGDYWHRTVPWNTNQSSSNTAYWDAPNGNPATFNGQINAWCATCHSRYTTSAISGYGTTGSGASRVSITGVPNGNAIDYFALYGSASSSGGGSYDHASGDAVFMYRHPTTGNKSCTTCHVAHGSNALMPGTGGVGDPNFSKNFPYPGGTIISQSSRLLKVDNRGTCQLCHDPTSTTVAGDYTGPLPKPGVP